MTKPIKNAVSIYGIVKSENHIKYEYSQRKRVYSKQAKQGYYLRKTGKTIKVNYVVTKKHSARFTIYGTPKQIAEAKVKIEKGNYIPKRTRDKNYNQDRVKAEKFIKNPQKYGEKGKWIGKEIKDSP